MHGGVARKMWSGHDDICKIDHITNAQHFNFWADPQLRIALDQDDGYAILERKKQLKKELFSIVADQTGKVFHEDIFTVVWARRFAGYKRAELPSWDLEAFDRMLVNIDYPIQIIWAGKPYPLDQGAINIFNHLVHITKKYNNCAVLVGYELNLSRALKQGADLWLNTPRITREASGTSGMTAAMNGAINFSTFDGWIPEFARHGENAFIIPPADTSLSIEEQDQHDLQNFYDLMEDKIIPMYYGKRNNWLKITKQSMRDILPFFDSSRMARQYYEILYNDFLHE